VYLLKRASWLRQIAAIGLVSSLENCASVSGVTPQEPPKGVAGSVSSPVRGEAGRPLGTGEAGFPGFPSSTVAGTAGPPPPRDAGIGNVGVGGGASVIQDASVVDASLPQAGRGASVPVVDAGVAVDPGVAAPPAAGCAGSMYALCEDFESAALDSKVWKLTQSKGTVSLDTTRGARGSKSSVHVHVEPGSDTTVGLTESKTFPLLKAGLFARAFIFIPDAMSTSLFTGDRHSRLIYAQGAEPYGEYALGIWNGGLIQNHYSKSDDSQDTKMLPPFDVWFCLEYELDSAAGNVKAYLNDMEITALRHDAWPASNIDTLMFGVDRYGSFPVAEDIWFDDLAVDSKRIGCTR
jgi:hypothetical protein